MPEIAVEETRLREILDELVRKHIKSSIDDVEEVRRSPAGTILRLEERVAFIQKNMATKTDIASIRTEIAELRAEQNERTGKVETTLGERIGKVETTLGERIGKVETTLGERIGKLETGQKIMFTVLFSFFSAIVAMLIKLVFFP